VTSLILEALDEHGLMLVHDLVLPSVTQLVVAGSWWAHPEANIIYNALLAIEDDVASVKLVRKKQKLVAKRLWLEIVTIGQSPSDTQLRGLDHQARALLAEINTADEPLIVEREQRDTAKDLATRLLVYATEVHTESGHHVNAYCSWTLWGTEKKVTPHDNVKVARENFEEIVSSWPSAGKSKLLSW
jgi:hypothetical protein